MRKNNIINEDDEDDDDLEFDSVYSQLIYLQKLEKEGKDIPSYYYPQWFDDDLLYSVKNGSNGWYVEVIFDSVEDFFKLFRDVSEYDMYTLNSLFSYYGSSTDYISGDSIWDDIKEGYSLSILETDESIEYLKEIMSFEAPELLPCLNTEENYKFDRSDICNKLIMNLLENEFYNEFENMVSNYVVEINQTVYDNLKEEVISEFCDLENYGFTTINCFYKYYISLDTLIDNFEEYGMTNNTVTELMSEMFFVNNFNGPIDLEQDVYDLADYNAAANESQSYTNGQFDKIIEKIEESYEDIDEFKNVKEWVNTNYPLLKTIPTKWNKNVEITVLDVDKNTNKINVRVKDGRDSKNKTKDALLTKEELNLLYHHPKLF